MNEKLRAYDEVMGEWLSMKERILRQLSLVAGMIDDVDNMIFHLQRIEKGKINDELQQIHETENKTHNQEVA